MANEEHLKNLKQCVEAWNKWRRENSEILPGLSGMNLSPKNQVREFNLKDTYLRKGVIRKCDLTKAILSLQIPPTTAFI